MKIVSENILKSPQETFQFGYHFSAQTVPGSILAFKGDLGAGKTTCIKGICSGMGVMETVTSPTFTLINEYQGRIPIYHFDFYSIHSDLEVSDLGLQEYFDGDGLCLIEWPDVIDSLLPQNRFEFHLKWDLEYSEDTRLLTIYSTED